MRAGTAWACGPSGAGRGGTIASPSIQTSSTRSSGSEPVKPEKYDDTCRKELLDLIRAKAEGEPLPEPAKEDEAEVLDLMSALRESVERTKKQRRKPAKRKAS